MNFASSGLINWVTRSLFKLCRLTAPTAARNTKDLSVRNVLHFLRAFCISNLDFLTNLEFAKLRDAELLSDGVFMYNAQGQKSSRLILTVLNVEKRQQ